MTKSPVCLIVPNSDGEDGSYSEHLLYTIYMCHVQCIYICTPLAFNAPPENIQIHAMCVPFCVSNIYIHQWLVCQCVVRYVQNTTLLPWSSFSRFFNFFLFVVAVGDCWVNATSCTPPAVMKVDLNSKSRRHAASDVYRLLTRTELALPHRAQYSSRFQ